jgi:putative flippase GtrA/GT2 family glycosyltransferase
MSTTREQLHAGGGDPTGLAASQSAGLGALLAIALGPADDLSHDIAVREGREPAVLVDPAMAPVAPTAPGASRARRAGRAAASGRHAAAPPPYLERRGARFVLFSAIGGTVFLMGLGLQALLTGRWHVQPVASYLIQAIVSVEASFLLNRWLTWRDRSTRFWLAFVRFNAQKTVTIALNLALYAGLLRLGMNYLVANVVLTAVFTVVNYVAGDRLVFIAGRTRTAEPAAPAAPDQVREHPTPGVSVVIPCRDNERTIGAAVQSLLDQDYPRMHEITLIGSPGDPTWSGLEGITDPRLSIWELKTPPGVRDANFKRDAAVKMTSGDLIALVDSDIVLPPDWMSRAVAALEDSGTSCVAGGMKSVHDSFWGRYTDGTWIGAKTPRVAESYTVTSANFGAGGRKPPISANILFTRELYERCPIDPLWSHGSYEDYEWFWRVTRAGYGIRVCSDLFGWHHHRRGLRALTKEYRRSSRGCAYFIRAHRDSPLAKRRLRQAVVLPLAALAGTIGAAAAAADGHGRAVAAVILGCAALLAVHQVVRSRSLESVAYPAVGIALGLVFTTGLVTNLIRPSPAVAATPIARSPTSVTQPSQLASSPRWRLLPLTAICAVQAALSLTLVWSNTAFADEADYISIGHYLIGHWLHGTSWPSTYAEHALSGSPFIYPPIGALADSIGGLAAARTLSLVFMLGATALLYFTASQLFGRTAAVAATALWAVTEPAIRLAFATYDPLSVFLTALSVWLALQAGLRMHRRKLAIATALALALANATAYSGVVIDPVVIAFAFLVWSPRMGTRQALSCTALLTGAWALFFGLTMTVSRSWAGILSTVIDRQAAGRSLPYVLHDVLNFAGLTIVLAVMGALVAISRKDDNRALVSLVSCAVFVVPAAQIYDRTITSFDKHLAYSLWFGAMAAGYGISRLLQMEFRGRHHQAMAALCCALAVTYLAVGNWKSAWSEYHDWANATHFTTSFRSVAAQSHGSFYVPDPEYYIAEFYSPRKFNWQRLNDSNQLPFDPPSLPRGKWGSFYTRQLQAHSFGAIALFYTTNVSGLPIKVVLSSRSEITRNQLLNLVSSNTSTGLPALTLALEKDSAYRLAAIGPYGTGTGNGVYAIWQKKVQK